MHACAPEGRKRDLREEWEEISSSRTCKREEEGRGMCDMNHFCCMREGETERGEDGEEEKEREEKGIGE